MIVLVSLLFYVHEIKDFAVNHNGIIGEFIVSDFFTFLHHNTSINVLEIAISALK
jgi:hypothetical protein